MAARNDSVWRAVQARLLGIADARVKVGVLESAGMTEDGKATLATVALANEFGTENGHIPERSFIRKTLRERKADIAKRKRDAVKRIIDGKSEPARELGLLGQYVASQIRATIRTSVPPPNAPSTIARKGSSRTLIDTGRLLNGVSYEVVFGKVA